MDTSQFGGITFVSTNCIWIQVIGNTSQFGDITFVSTTFVDTGQENGIHKPHLYRLGYKSNV